MESFGRCEITLESDLADEKRLTHLELARLEESESCRQILAAILVFRGPGTEELVGLIASPV